MDPHPRGPSVNPWLPLLPAALAVVATCSHGEESPLAGPVGLWLLILLRVFQFSAWQSLPDARQGPQGWPRWLGAELLQSFSPAWGAPGIWPSKPPVAAAATGKLGTDASRCRGGSLKVFVYSAVGPISETPRKVLSFHRAPATTQPALRRLASSSSSSAPTPPLESATRRIRSGMGAEPSGPQSPPHPLASGSSSWDRRWWPRASPTVDTFRPGFDVALPLPEAHPLRGGALGPAALAPLGGPDSCGRREGRVALGRTNFSACPWDGRCEQDHGPKQ